VTVHDLVVVGAGIGGLTAAAVAARRGLDVVVLERHTRPGGSASDFPRRGLLIPAGATLVTGFEPGGLHRAVYEELGIPIVARRLAEPMRVVLPDREVRIGDTWEAWQGERGRAFPELGSAGDRLWMAVRRAGDVAHDLAVRRPRLPLETLGDLWSVARLVSRSLLMHAPWMWWTVGDVLRRHRVDHHLAHRRFIDAQLLITMQCEADQCVALNGALALELYRHGAFYLPGGPTAIARELVGSIQRSSGEVRHGCEVVRVSPSRSRWCVSMSNAEAVEARAVILNVPAENARMMLGESADPSWSRRARATNTGWGAVVVYAAIRAAAIERELPAYVQTVQSLDGPLEEGGSAFVSIYPPDQPRHPEWAPMTISTHTRVEPWLAIDDEREYQERKAALAQRLLDSAIATVPGLRGNVVFWEASTPRSFRRWIGRAEGRVGGVSQTRANANLRTLSARTGVPGLFVCGDTVFPGQGTIGVTLSGLTAAAHAIRELDAPHAGSRCMMHAGGRGSIRER
jgi:C-3',4' desaturase CrtD